MALSFPLTAAAFWDKLLIGELDFDLVEAVETSTTEGGDTLVRDRGTRLWTGQVTLGAMTYHEFSEVSALIGLMRSGPASFLMWDTRLTGPRLDPGGAALGASTPQLATVTVERREFTSTGWPGGYVLSPGDLVGFSYASPARRALHRCVTGATAAIGGAMGAVEVTPAIREGLTPPVGLSVLRPLCEARIVPGSFDRGTQRHGTVWGAAFAFTQVRP